MVKIGGQGLELAAKSSRQRMHKLGNFAALSIGGKDRSGPTDLSDVAVWVPDTRPGAVPASDLD